MAAVRLPRLVVVLLAAIEVFPKVIGKPEEPAAELVHVVPLEVSTFPVVPGATASRAPVPLPSNTLLDVNVANPVPPCAAVMGVDTLEIVAFVSVKLPTLEVVLPSVMVALPSVAELLAR